MKQCVTGLVKQNGLTWNMTLDTANNAESKPLAYPHLVCSAVLLLPSESRAGCCCAACHWRLVPPGQRHAHIHTRRAADEGGGAKKKASAVMSA